MINRRSLTVPPALPRAAISPQRLPWQANNFSHLRLETANMRVEPVEQLNWLCNVVSRLKEDARAEKQRAEPNRDYKPCGEIHRVNFLIAMLGVSSWKRPSARNRRPTHELLPRRERTRVVSFAGAETPCAAALPGAIQSGNQHIPELPGIGCVDLFREEPRPAIQRRPVRIDTHE